MSGHCKHPDPAGARHGLVELHSARPFVSTVPEELLIDVVGEVLACLGSPDGYFPDIGCPLTRKLQRAYVACAQPRGAGQ